MSNFVIKKVLSYFLQILRVFYTPYSLPGINDFPLYHKNRGDLLKLKDNSPKKFIMRVYFLLPPLSPL